MLNQLKYKLNLQYFAEPEPEPTPDPEPSPEPEPEPDNTTFSKSELDSSISKAVDKALARQKEKFEAEKQQAIEDAKKDAQEYATLTEKERQQKDFEKRQKQLEDREREINNRELLGQIKEDLAEEELPTSFADSLLLLGDNEKIKTSISIIKADWQKSVNEGIKAGLRQETPPGINNGITQTKKLPSLREMAEKTRKI